MGERREAPRSADEPELVVEGEIVSEGEDASADASAVDWEQVALEHLDALQRARADFDNFRKRSMREQTDVIARATQNLVARLLPVLDNFDRAIAHGDTSPGLALVHRDLLDVLQSEGLERIEAEGRPFDPHHHEAVDSHEDPGVEESVVSAVHQAGYLFKGKVLRPALVAVARPVEDNPTSPDDVGRE